MSAIIAKTAMTVVKPFLPYVRLLPVPVVTLIPQLALHYSTTPNPSPTTFFADHMTHPLHPPLLMTLLFIPMIYIAGVATGNVSWVDRMWPFFTPVCSMMIVRWGLFNRRAGYYGHNLPRLLVMMFLQALWCLRLVNHARKRGFYKDLKAEDYRYTQFKKIVPNWLFQLVHLFVIAIAQPLLLFSLCLPLQAVLAQPPSELSSGPFGLFVPYSVFLAYLPPWFRAAPPDTPCLHLGDFALLLIGLGLLVIEGIADNQMYAYQESKHKSKGEQMVSVPKVRSKITAAPQPTSYPKSHYPGFITSGLFKWTRHPNFAAEQLFWLNQALFVVIAGESSGVTRSGWVSGGVFGPCFGLSILFCASTFLTEWITENKYPLYGSYKKITGQFLPQETVVLWLWTTLRGTRTELAKQVYQAPPTAPAAPGAESAKDK